MSDKGDHKSLEPMDAALGDTCSVTSTLLESFRLKTAALKRSFECKSDPNRETLANMLMDAVMGTLEQKTPSKNALVDVLFQGVVRKSMETERAFDSEGMIRQIIEEKLRHGVLEKTGLTGDISESLIDSVMASIDADAGVKKAVLDSILGTVDIEDELRKSLVDSIEEKLEAREFIRLSLLTVLKNIIRKVESAPESMLDEITDKITLPDDLKEYLMDKLFGALDMKEYLDKSLLDRVFKQTGLGSGDLWVRDIGTSTHTIGAPSEAEETEEKQEQDAAVHLGEVTYTSHDSEYLKRHLGVPLSLALADIACRRPTDPIHYLGHWLYKWRYNQERHQEDAELVAALSERRAVVLAEQRERERLAEERRAAEEAEAEARLLAEAFASMVDDMMKHSLEQAGEGDEEAAEEELDAPEEQAVTPHL